MTTGLTRRRLLIGGGAGLGLLVGFAALPRRAPPNLVAAVGEHVLDPFLKIGEDGHVTVIVGQAEMGQGVWTSLPQILADALGADWRTVGVETAPIHPAYANELIVGDAAAARAPAMLDGLARSIGGAVARQGPLMLTGGSTSIRAFEAKYRHAGAVARALLCMAAAERWGVAWEACDTEAGFVTRGTDRLRFGELAAKAATLTPPDDPPPRGRRPDGLVGKSVPRLDLPAKVDGSIRFAADVRLPDMVFAAIRQGPLGDSVVTGFDTAKAFAVPHLLAVIDRPGWVAAVATNTWAAERALEAMGIAFTSRAARPSQATIDAALEQALATGAGGRFAEAGGLGEVFRGREVITARYAVPFAAHAPIEPLVATARFSGDRLEVWAPVQAQVAARDAAARAIGLSPVQVTLYPMPIGGGFGRKAETDAVEQVAVLAAKLKRPVQLCWSREEETRAARNRPPARAAMAARLAPDGRILGWQARIAAPSTMGEMMVRGGTRGMGGAGEAEAAAVEGARPPYAIPALAVDHLPVDLGVPTGMWRSVAHSYTAFFTESFVDELAALGGQDPFGYRVQMLGGQPRLARCLTGVAALGGWQGPGNGQGLALHAGFGSYAAVLAEARIADGRVRVDRLAATVDVGRVIHPEIVRQQVESGLIWGLAAALGGAITYADGLPEQTSFADLGLPVLADTPEILVEIVASDAAPGGVGELAVPPVAPAIANALAAGGRRMRTLPLRSDGA
ncbi:xanthine dehydrogenase family protein molybdopterin-binding subunit [Sphingomonas jatrophae]|uniref:Isoquinoline 1-oxidoreductase, beta subunit n=1 Tax=Sphingomonas jatrophae TaxID=1166337 RepID=A0A1I6LMV5_9SPHN|nr:molybdopterin cofactor-binding domain-containing protein [Sphingomonas jatrophae]SFS04739.1 isoquinoline 1-oxidoreductase, beta subunit [Sphingomonas jatrophae]